MKVSRPFLLFFLLFSVLIYNDLFASDPVQRPDIIKDAEIVSVQNHYQQFSL